MYVLSSGTQLKLWVVFFKVLVMGTHPEFNYLLLLGVSFFYPA